MRPTDLGLVLIVMMIWGLNFVIGKWGVSQVPPIFLIALRFGLVAILLLPFVKAPRGKLAGILALSTTLGCVHFSLMFTGLRDVDAAVASIAIQTQVPFAALLAALVLGDRLGWRRMVGMALAFAGIAVMAGEPRFSSNLIPIGLVVAGAFMWAVGNIQIKQLGAVDGFALSAYMSAFAVPQLLLASALLETGQVPALGRANWQVWASIAYMAVAVTIVSYAMWYRLLRRYTVNQTMPFTLLVPIFGVMSGVLLLDEPLTWRVAVGGLVTVAGVGIIVFRRPRLADPEAASKTV